MYPLWRNSDGIQDNTCPAKVRFACALSYRMPGGDFKASVSALHQSFKSQEVFDLDRAVAVLSAMARLRIAGQVTKGPDTL